MVALSSTALVPWLLEGSGDTNTGVGRTMVSVLLFQDLAVVPMMLALPLLAGHAATAGDVTWLLGRSVAVILLTVLGARFAFPWIIARTRYLREVEPLAAHGADQVIPEEFETSLELTGRVLALYGASPYVVEREKAALRREGYGLLRGEAEHDHPTLHAVGQISGVNLVPVPPGSEAIGQTLRELDLRRRTGATVLAVERCGELQVNPPPELRLETGDGLLAFVDGAALDAMTAALAPK